MRHFYWRYLSPETDEETPSAPVAEDTLDVDAFVERRLAGDEPGTPADTPAIPSGDETPGTPGSPFTQETPEVAASAPAVESTVPDKYKIRYTDHSGQMVEESLSLEELAAARAQARQAGLTGRRHGDERQAWDAERTKFNDKLSDLEGTLEKVRDILPAWEKITGDEAVFDWLKTQIPGLTDAGGAEVDSLSLRLEQEMGPFKEFMGEYMQEKQRTKAHEMLSNASGALGFPADMPGLDASIAQAAKVVGIKNPYENPMMPTLLFIGMAALNGELVHRSSMNPDKTMASASETVDNAIQMGTQLPPDTAAAPMKFTPKAPDQYATLREYYVDAVKSGKCDKEFANALLPEDQQI